MKLIKLTDRRGQVAIVNAESIIEITQFEQGSLVKMDCRAIGHQNNQGAWMESPDQIMAMISGEPQVVGGDSQKYATALQQICLLADTGSDLHKQTFDPDGIGVNTPGWRVAEKMREIARDVLGKDGR